MSSDWQVGKRIQDRWEIHKILPPGGMGIVYVVYDHHFQVPAALKTFKEEAFGRSRDVAYFFTQEALAWIDLGRHENITHARSVETINWQEFLCLEYVSGGDLGNWIGTPRLTEDLPQVLRFAIQFCDGMIYARSRGIQVHRDIKPANCLITRDLTLKVTDFGLAKIFDGTQEAGTGTSAQEAEAPNIGGLSIGVTRTGRAAGTCTHMAPEQFDDAKHVDVRADIYSFGIMLYQMITGRVPFRGRTWEELEGQHKTQLPPLVPGDPSLAAVVATCLAKQPTLRFPDFTSLRARLATIFEIVTGEPAPQPVTDLRRDSNDWHRKADALAELGYRIEAVASYDRALELNPHCEETWFNKGVLLAHLGSYKEALACYDRALELNPRNEIGWSHKAIVLGKLGRHEQKVACCDRALELNPRYEEARFIRGVALANLGRYEDALACYNEVSIDVPAACFNKGIILAKLGRHEEALTCFNRSACFPCKEKFALLRKLGRHEEANAYIGEFIEDFLSDSRSEFELLEIPPTSEKPPGVPSNRSYPRELPSRAGLDLPDPASCRAVLKFFEEEEARRQEHCGKIIEHAHALGDKAKRQEYLLKAGMSSYWYARFLRTHIRARASAAGMVRNGDPLHFIVAKWTPQGWLLEDFPDWVSAEAYAVALHRAGNRDIYVMSSNEMHDLQEIVDGRVEFTAVRL